MGIARIVISRCSDGAPVQMITLAGTSSWLPGEGPLAGFRVDVEIKAPEPTLGSMSIRDVAEYLAKRIADEADEGRWGDDN